MKHELLMVDRLSVVQRGVSFLDQMSFRIYEGEIFGMLFINSHGQENLIEVIERNVPIHYGTVYFNGRVVNHHQNSDGRENPAVVTLGGKSTLFQGFSVLDNIFVFNSVKHRYIINEKEMLEQFRPLAQAVDLTLVGTEIVDDLTAYERFVVELLKAVYSGAKLIILRDISNILGSEDVQKVQSLMHYFKSRNISFCYICNHHEEIFKIADRTILIEYGFIIKHLYKEDYSDEVMARFSLNFAALGKNIAIHHHAKTLVEWNSVTTDYLRDFTLTVNAGESVVVLDRQKNVLQDLARTILEPSADKNRVMKHVNRNDVLIIPENPLETFLFRDFSYLDNLTLGLVKKIPTKWLRKKTHDSIRKEYGTVLKDVIDMDHLHNATTAQLFQLVYYKALIYNPKLVLIFQPFANADMYLRHDIINLINQMRSKGITVMVFAVSVSDTRYISNRMVVINDGCVVEEIVEADYDTKILEMY
ncbi:hypothetical protein G7062_10215 [Erysipelothrix sp. HDW6C]|uniref:hypothetical protein n=1 Tax=Erysipelothrix sp. HDW6C TaxID=2714930 RepID=UPI00140CD60B|nr:hypothetical protein [Erysipelothrix sp. HDW6C]QIK70655.1 hypothetical protein G7062_10215 [Erysipelothrix sp. HDW6C]